MTKLRNNLHLTRDDQHVLAMVLVKLGAKLDNINKKYSNVEKSSKKALSSIQSNKGQILLSLVFMDFQPMKEYSRDELTKGQILLSLVFMDFQPMKEYSRDELTTKVAERFAAEIDTDKGDMLSDFEREHSQNPNSNRLSEVLKSLKDKNFLSRTVGKRKGKDKIYGQPKKRGPNSVYNLSPQAVQLKSLLDKPEVIDILINGLTDSGLLQSFLKLVFKGFIYMIKNGDEKLVSKRFCMFSANKLEEIPFVTEQVHLLKERIKDVNDKEMDKKADEAATYLLPKMTDYISRMALIYGVSELD